MGSLNIRSGPSIENIVLDVLYEGERFTILDETEGWLYIRRDVEGKPDIEGWVNGLWVIR